MMVTMEMMKNPSNCCAVLRTVLVMILGFSCLQDVLSFGTLFAPRLHSGCTHLFSSNGVEQCPTQPANNVIVGTDGTQDPSPSEAKKAHLNEELLRLTSKCVEESLERHKSWVDEESHPLQGSWIIKDLFRDIEGAFGTAALKKSDFTNALLGCSKPMTVTLFEEKNQYSLKMVCLPPESKFDIHMFEVGTMLLLKPMTGACRLQLKTTTHIFLREEYLEINTLQSGCVDDHDIISSTPVLFRYGGHERTLINDTPYPAAFLELAVYPPLGYGGEASVSESAGLRENEREVADLPHLKSILTNLPIGGMTEILFVGDDSNDLAANLIAENTTRMFKKDGDDTFASQLNNMEISSIGDDTRPTVSTDFDIYTNMTQRVGGLGQEIKDIIRRVLLTRKLPPSTLSALGLSHVRGILLYGPPGNGKTLIAREIARVLKSRRPKIVNGPEIFDKFVGEAEKNVRELFEDAEEEWERVGVRSELHVIILDEFDAIAKKRGTLVGDGSGARDSVVNQLLSKIDGVAEMSNVLLIALTNRKDLIDPALLRPGRLEVHIEIKQPTGAGRKEILDLLFRPIVKEGVVSQEDANEWIDEIIPRTEGWSGADLTGLIRSAASFAIERCFQHELDGHGIHMIHDSNLSSDLTREASPAQDFQPISSTGLILCYEDFEKAFQEISPTPSESSTDTLSDSEKKSSFTHRAKNAFLRPIRAIRRLRSVP